MADSLSSSGGLDVAANASVGASASRQQQAQDATTTHVLAATYDAPRAEELRRRGVPEHLYFYSLVSSPMKDDRTYTADCEDGAEGGEEIIFSVPSSKISSRGRNVPIFPSNYPALRKNHEILRNSNILISLNEVLVSEETRDPLGS